MNHMRRCGAGQFVGWLAMGLLAVAVMGASQHAIHDVVFDPPSPASLEFGQLVNYKLNYRTTEPGGVHILGWPMSGGSYSGDMWHAGSPLYPAGSGSASGAFTINAGAKTVDQVRFQMIDARGNALFQMVVDVRYAFGQGDPGVEDCVCEEKIQTEYGDFHVCVNVERHDEQGWDCYTYTITNIDYCREHCGICVLFVRNTFGHATMSQWGPPDWLVNMPDGQEWSWQAPTGSCGIMPGETAKFGFCVPAPTDVVYDQEAAVWGCDWGIAVTGAHTMTTACPWKMLTCGPGRRVPDDVRCTYTINPTSWVAPECGGRTLVQVSTQANCTWTAQSNVAWLSVSSASGTGSASTMVTASSNLTGQTRTGTVTYSGTGWTATLTVHQRPCVQACTYTINPTSARFSARGGSVRVEVISSPNCRWTATSPCGWVTVSPSSGTGSAVVRVSVEVMSPVARSRSCTLTIAGQTFTVTQTP